MDGQHMIAILRSARASHSKNLNNQQGNY